jgi:hypothetical protein
MLSFDKTDGELRQEKQERQKKQEGYVEVMDDGFGNKIYRTISIIIDTADYTLFEDLPKWEDE